MKIALGCDHGAYLLKNKVADHLRKAGYEVVDWVIGMPMGEEQKVLLETLDRAAQAIPVVITQGMDRAMNRFN